MHVGTPRFPNTPSPDMWPQCSRQESRAGSCMKIKGARSLGLRAIVVFGWHTTQILLPRVIFYRENFLCLLAQQPKISHVHGTRSLSLYCVIHNTYRRRVVDMDWGGRLRVAYFVKSEAFNSCFHFVQEQGAQFSLRCGCSYAFYNCALRQHCVVKFDGTSVAN